MGVQRTDWSVDNLIMVQPTVSRQSDYNTAMMVPGHPKASYMPTASGTCTYWCIHCAYKKEKMMPSSMHTNMLDQ